MKVSLRPVAAASCKLHDANRGHGVECHADNVRPELKGQPLISLIAPQLSAFWTAPASAAKGLFPRPQNASHKRQASHNCLPRSGDADVARLVKTGSEQTAPIPAISGTKKGGTNRHRPFCVDLTRRTGSGRQLRRGGGPGRWRLGRRRAAPSKQAREPGSRRSQWTRSCRCRRRRGSSGLCRLGSMRSS